MDGFVDIFVVKICCLETSMETLFSQIIHAYQSYIVELFEFGNRAESMRESEKQIKQTATANTPTDGILLLNTFELKNKDLTKGGAFFKKYQAQTMSKNTIFTNLWDFCENYLYFGFASCILLHKIKYNIQQTERCFR